MINRLRVQGFKSWKDTGDLRIAPITGLFGTNSSGKTAILQVLLMLKQTVESTDRSRVLYLGDERTYVDLGTFYDIVHAHALSGAIRLDMQWTLPKSLKVIDPESRPGRTLFATDAVRFLTEIESEGAAASVNEFFYEPHTEGHSYRFGMRRQQEKNGDRTRNTKYLSAAHHRRRKYS